MPTARRSARLTAESRGRGLPEWVATGSWSKSTVGFILAEMTIGEKVGQMVQAEIGGVSVAQARQYDLGSVLNGGGSWPNGKNSSIADWVALADSFYEASTDISDGGVGIPLIWGTDAVHGHNNVIGSNVKRGSYISHKRSGNLLKGQMNLRKSPAMNVHTQAR